MVPMRFGMGKPVQVAQVKPREEESQRCEGPLREQPCRPQKPQNHAGRDEAEGQVLALQTPGLRHKGQDLQRVGMPQAKRQGDSQTTATPCGQKEILLPVGSKHLYDFPDKNHNRRSRTGKSQIKAQCSNRPKSFQPLNHPNNCKRHSYATKYAGFEQMSRHQVPNERKWQRGDWAEDCVVWHQCKGIVHGHGHHAMTQRHCADQPTQQVCIGDRQSQRVGIVDNI
mmetsp:Transcript_64098/g.132856  ORF Transcript_64098/g.132856 Transcript_64098/m.132856 type:complete len:226 (-) Transcript_64098:73-750(-)